MAIELTTGLNRCAHERPSGEASRKASDGIRLLIMRNELSPGTQIRQEELAVLLGMSRSPIREALRELVALGFVNHRPRVGYFVSKRSPDQLRELYLMRQLLETELIKSLGWPDATGIDRLQHLNGEVEYAARTGVVASVVNANRDFHFAIFGQSNLPYVFSEVERLWMLSEQYRAMYFVDGNACRRSVREHSAMIKAVANRNRSQLIAVADEHRAVAMRQMLALLSGAVLQTAAPAHLEASHG